LIKVFLLWLVIFCILFGGIALFSHNHFSRNPRKIVIAIDTSVEMKSEENEVFDTIRRIGERRYSEFSIISDKSIIEEWGPLPNNYSTSITYYGPRDLEKLVDAVRYPRLSDADEIVFVTNSEDTSVLDNASIKNYSVVK